MAKSKGVEIVTIDPGTKTTGVAFWDRETWKDLVPPTDVFAIAASSANNWYTRMAGIIDALDGLFAERTVLRAYIELPTFMQSHKGQTAAKSGSLVKLSAMFGAVYMSCHNIAAKVKPVRIVDWKGQLPKNVTERRIRKRLGNLEHEGGIGVSVPSDCWDAVGIGLWAKGHF